MTGARESLISGIKELETPSETRKGNGLGGLVLAASRQAGIRSVPRPPTVDRDCQIVDVREHR